MNLFILESSSSGHTSSVSTVWNSGRYHCSCGSLAVERGKRKTAWAGEVAGGCSRCPGRKPFGLFQFDFSSVAVALTTIRRRDSPLALEVSPLSTLLSQLSSLNFPLLFSLFVLLSDRTNGLRPDARIEPWSIESRCLSSSLPFAFFISWFSFSITPLCGHRIEWGGITSRYRCVRCVGPPTPNGWTCERYRRVETRAILSLRLVENHPRAIGNLFPPLEVERRPIGEFGSVILSLRFQFPSRVSVDRGCT